MRHALPVLCLALLTLAACGGDEGNPTGGSGAAADASAAGDGGGSVDSATGTADATGSDAVGTPDTSATDTGTPDTGATDTGTTDTGAPDTSTTDTGAPDSGTPDTGAPDAGTPDSGTPDSGTTDSGTPDSGTPDTGTTDTGTTDTGTTDTGTPECSQDTDCAAKDDGDLCNGVWSCEAGTCKAKANSAVTCASDQDTACSKATCTPQTGACAQQPVADGATCSDGDACTLTDTCKAGVCAAGSAAVCDDKNPCTQDSCDKSKGCQAAPVSDGASCGAGQLCAAGACVSALAAGQCGVGGVKPCRTLAAGFGHMCAKFGATVRCWGANHQGQLGTGGSNVMTKQPGTAVIGVANVAAVVGGWSYGCALQSDGKVACWGGNTRGELGNGKSAKDYPKDKAFEAKAALVAGLSGVVDLAGTTAGTVCALTNAGVVSCWGSGATGSLADGKTGADHLVTKPQVVAGLKDVVSLSAGSGHLCAVDKAGALWCWGFNGYGQIGNGKTAADYANVDLAGESAPLQVATTVAQAWASGRNTCARLTTGKVQCWGTNYYGQVANGKTWKDYTTSSSEAKPTATLGIDGALAMGGHFFHRCAVLPKGVLKCWGTTFHGALGNGASGNDDAVVAPVTVTLPAPAVDVVGGGFNVDGLGSSAHTCARLATGAVHCWGFNGWGQLGDGTNTNNAKPVAVQVATCTDAKGCDDANTCTTDTCVAGYCAHAVAGGSCDDGNACTLKDACDAGFCTAGADANCDDKDPCTVDSCDPKTAQCKHTAAADGATCGGGLVCSQAKCVSALGQGQCGADGSEPCKRLAAGGAHTCRVASGAQGSVQCWGAGTFGQRGVSPAASANAPGGSAVGVSDAVHIVTGQGHTCALRKTGQVVCWGLNGQGQLGNGKQEQDYPKDKGFEVTAVPVSGLTDVVHLAASRFATCAVRAGGTVSCWGTNFLGQVGPATAPQTTPVALKDIVDAVAISAGDDHFCVRTAKGAVQCWGWAGYGQLGNGKVQTDYPKATEAFSAVPLTVAGLGGVDRLWGGGSTVCARETDGKVQCWGRNDYGQTGNGKALPDYPAGKVAGQPNPAVIPSLYGAASMVGGATHRCLRTPKGLVGCWGQTTYGALGQGSSGANTYVPAPALVNLVGSGAELAAGSLVGTTATYAHTCASLSNGQTWCWGSNAFGTLGDGSTTDANKPVQVK